MGAAALGRSVWLTRNKRNYGVPLLLAALASAHLLYLTAAVSGDYLGLMRYFNAGLLSMAVLTLLIARRVLPFFAARRGRPGHSAAYPERPLAARGRRGRHRAAATGAPKGAALALAASGLIALVQWLAWKPWPRGACRCCDPVHRLPGPEHRAAGRRGATGRPGRARGLARARDRRGRLLGHDPGMVTRTALGHLGRPLQTDRSMVLSYALIILAALLRLAALLPSSAVTGLLHASATAWALAQALYLWRFSR